MKYDICMLVDTLVKRDSRVIKEAKSLTNYGFSVVVIGVAKDTDSSFTQEIYEGFTLLQFGYVSGADKWVQLFYKIVTYGLALLHRLLSIVLPISMILRGIEYLFRYTSRNVLPFSVLARQGLQQVDARYYHAHDYPAAVVISQQLVPFIYDSHELYFERDLPTKSLPRFIISSKHRVERRIETRIAKQAISILTVSASIADFMADAWGLKRPAVLKNAVDLRHLQDAEIQYPVPADVVKLVHSGSLASGRNLKPLVASLKYLPDNIVLILMGDGSLKEALQQIAEHEKVAHRLYFVPPVKPLEVSLTMRQADIAMVLTDPSIGLNGQYALPNKLFESIAAGLPIVSTTGIEIAKIVKDYKLGVICDDPSDPQSIATAVQKMIANDAYKTYRQAVEKAREEINWEHEEKQLIQLYDNLLATKESSH